MSLTTMSQNQEIIEAKLCAYIDGELDLEGRSEIERHLEANPQHRRLLESLKATKDLVRWLPREQAPPEVAETLNGQLERSVLLDYDGDSLRPSIWPRVLAAAAIVALTAGLAAAVYFALPKSQKQATPYAFHGPSEPSTLTPAASPEVTPSEAEKPGEPVVGKSETPLAGVTQLRDRLQEKEGPAVAGQSKELEELARRVSQNRDALLSAANNGNQSPAPLANNAMVMLVRSDAPQRTEKQLVSFLDSQNIRWKEAPVQQPEAVAPEADANRGWYDAGRQRVAGRTTAARSLNQSATTQAAQEQENAAASVAVSGVYVARMSRDQAVQLNSAIANEAGQTVALQSAPMAGGLVAPSDAAATSPSPTTAPAEQLSAVAPSPMPPAPANAEAAKQGFQFGQSPTTAPTSQPSDQGNTYQLGRMTASVEAGMLAQRSAPASAPATQPTTQPAAAAAAPTTQPTELALDVVILVQPNTVTNSATAPATQPAASTPSDAADPPATQPAH